MTTFYKNFVKHCVKNGYSVSGAAKAIGLSNAAASGWKNGKVPTSTTQEKIAALFGISVETLMQEDPVQTDDGTKEVFLMSFAQWLQIKMDQHGFTNYRIAKMAGVHQSTVANWLSGAKPQAEKEKLVRLAVAEYESAFCRSESIKKERPAQGGTLSPEQQAAWDLLQKMDDETLRRFIRAAQAMLGE